MPLITLEVLNKVFAYKNLKLYHNPAMFSISIESILLPHFANINHQVKSIIDIGTNNGLIPLILTTKTTAHITGVEIEPQACKLAVKNINLNQKSDQIKVINTDILAFKPSKQKFDLIICNPPFFSLTKKYHDQHHQKLKKLARHEIKLSLNDLLAKVRTLISHRGYFVLCYRVDRLPELMTKLVIYNFEPKRIQFIHPKANAEAKVFMIECRFQAGVGMRVLKPIVCHNHNNTFKRSVIRLYRP